MILVSERLESRFVEILAVLWDFPGLCVLKCPASFGAYEILYLEEFWEKGEGLI